jgi:acetyl-CoA acetyltransferase
MLSTTPENADWVRRKRNTVELLQRSSYSVGLSAAGIVYEQAGIGPEDLDVVELHDCFAQNELITYEALGLCREGEAAAFIAAGGNTYGGKTVTNPSGGLLSKVIR